MYIHVVPKIKTMHVLDLIMYFVLAGVIWWIMDLIWGGEITEELGGLVGVLVIVVYTIWYLIHFVFGDLNWIDIFNGTKHINIPIIKW